MIEFRKLTLFVIFFICQSCKYNADNCCGKSWKGIEKSIQVPIFLLLFFFLLKLFTHCLNINITCEPFLYPCFFNVPDNAGLAGSEKTTSSGRRHYDLSRQMSLLRAATTTRIDDELSPANVTAIRGETALLVCTVLNIGDKSVNFLVWYILTN